MRITLDFFVEYIAYFSFLAGIITHWFITCFFPSYMKEKGKNRATLEDISKITDKIEEVKNEYASQLQEISHQNDLLIKHTEHKQQLRMAALERRLQAHQEAYTLWREMLSSLHNENNFETVLKCQEWYNNNCLYLDSESRQAFRDGYSAMSHHPDLLQARTEAEAVKDNFYTITSVGEILVRGVELPSLGEQETELVSEESAPNKSIQPTAFGVG